MAARRARSDFHASSAGARRGPPPRFPAAPPVRSLPPNVGTAVMSRTGTRTRTSMSGRPSEATTRTGWGPPRKRAISSRGRTVADSPMRCAGFSSRSSRRSRLKARCAPRLLPANACTSSTMTVSTVRSVSRACDVSMRYSDSGVVMRMSGGLRCRLRRWSGVVSPVRMPVRTSGIAPPAAAMRAAMPASGACKLRSTSAPSAFSGEMYSTRTPLPGRSFFGKPAVAAFSRISSSMANRNAASVLPEPVGAMTSAFSPPSITSQARSCNGVGSGKASRNQPRTSSENRVRA